MKNKGPLGCDPPTAPSNVPTTTSVKKPRAVTPKGPPGAGVGPSPSGPKEGTVPNEDMIRALQLLQGLTSTEDFSKYEKMVSPPKKEEKVKDREQLLWEKVQSQNKLLKVEAEKVEQIAKLEHHVAQQQSMLQDVRSELEVVRHEVCDVGFGCGPVCAHGPYA